MSGRAPARQRSAIAGAPLCPAPAGRRRVGQLLACLAAALVLAGAGGLVVEHVTAERARAEEWASTMARNRAQLLPRTPAGAAGALLSAIADDDPAVGCGSMSPAAGDQLAAALGVQDCPAAVAAMHRQVVDPVAYESPDAGSIAEALSGDRARGRVNACSLTWGGLPAILGTPRSTGPPPGPQLGVLDVQREQGAGYRVTAYGRCRSSRTRQ